MFRDQACQPARLRMRPRRQAGSHRSSPARQHMSASGVVAVRLFALWFRRLLFRLRLRFWRLALHLLLLLLLTLLQLLRLLLMLLFHLLMPRIIGPLLFGSSMLLVLLSLQVLPFLLLLLVHLLRTPVVVLIGLGISAGWRAGRTVRLRHVVRMNIGRPVVRLRSARARRPVGVVIPRFRTVVRAGSR